MAKNQNTFEKRRREIEKKQRAEEKRKRRQTKKQFASQPGGSGADHAEAEVEEKEE